MNNWQSWGPMQKMTPGAKLEGIEERMANYSRYVFTPIPDLLSRFLVSDYFIAWEGGLAGFLTSNIAHPYFSIEGDEIVGYLEYFETPFADPIPLEPLVVLEGEPVEQLLEEYGIRVAAANGVRINPWNPIGWSSWYQYFAGLRFEDIEKNLNAAREHFPFEVFQVDEGFESDIGDWLEVKPGFPPLASLAQLIQSFGFRAGLWAAPFSATQTSHLFRLHPGWFVSDIGIAKFCYKIWGKSVFALDTTNPHAKNWLFETFAGLKKMGWDYFKIDFLFAAAIEGVRSRRVTPIQAYREGLEVIRRAVGGSFILGCGAPLLPSLGFVDGMRIGEDTAPFWDSRKSAVQGPNAYWALKNSILRSFMHKKWWLNDPDCLLLRAHDIELVAGERALYARTAGALDNMLIESDDLELVEEEGKALLAEAIRLRGGHFRVRGMLSDGAYLIDSWSGPSGTFRFAVNLGDEPRKQGERDVPPRTGIFLIP
jgi:alpha-galactosidase